MQAAEIPPKTQYARSGDLHIAYQIVGEGSLDLVYVPGWISHVELSARGDGCSGLGARRGFWFF